MKTILATTLAILICATVGLAVTVFVQKGVSRKHEAKLTSLQTAQTNTQTAIATKESTIELLQTKLEQMTQALTNSTAKMIAMSERLLDYQLKEQAEHETKKVRSEKDEIPPPTGFAPSLTFPKVVSKTGKVLAVNAQYVKYPGRKLVFRPPDALAIAVDVAEIHPRILEYLGLDPETLVSAQQNIDAQWRASLAASRAEGERIFQAQQQAAELRAKMANEKAQADAALIQASAAQVAADAQRAKAEAMAQAAEAAMINALNPQPSVVIQNQNNQDNRPSYWWR